MIRIGLVSNPRSRRNKRGFGRIERILTHRAGARRADIIHIPIEANALAEVVSELARREVGLIAINGGDGTVQRMLTALLAAGSFATPPLLAVLPGGTTNLIAHDLGFRGGLRHSLSRLLGIVEGGQLESSVGWRHVMRAENLDGHPPQRCMFFGAASLAEAAAWHQGRRRHHEAPATVALTSAAMRLMGAAVGSRDAGAGITPERDPTSGQGRTGERIQVCLDDRDYGDRHRFMMLVTTLDRLVFGLRPWRSHGHSPGGRGWGAAPLRFASIAHPPRRLLRSLAHVALGGDAAELSRETYQIGSANRIAVRLRGPVVLDGELFLPRPQRPVMITSGPPLAFVQG